MAEATFSHTALETPSDPFDAAFMAAAGFLAGYTGTTLTGYKIDLRGWFTFCEQHDLPVLEVRRPHIELYIRNLEESVSEIQRVAVGDSPAEGWFTLTFRRQTTRLIAHDTTAADLQIALEALLTIGPDNVTVTAPEPGVWDVLFTDELGARAVPMLGADQAELHVTVDRVVPGRRRYARSTIARRISTVACFYQWCTEEDIIVKNPAVHIRRPKAERESSTLGLDRNELGAFLVQAGLSNARDHALAVLLGLNGLRVSEACNANIQDLASGRGHRTLTVVRKGGWHEIIPLAPRTARAIDLAITASGERCEGPILLRADGARLDRCGAYRIVKRLARRAGITHKVSPHSLRHASITGCLDAGVDIRDTQAFAGHADPRTTIHYDRNRRSLDRHATYILAAYVAGASGGH